MEKFHRSQGGPAAIIKTPPLAQTSKSMPSTPSQRPRSRSNPRRSPSSSRTTNNTSPRSFNSDSSQTPPASRKPAGGCKYETAMAKARRRVPYSLGPDKLEQDTSEIPSKLSTDDEKRLTRNMQSLYEQLLPSAESEQRRTRFVQKLEKLLRGRWPGFVINAAVFGSTGNNLGSSDSDVDICITTDCKELERVCSIAELLAKHGMERVVCVSSAKVPIVKVWDPELQVACDLNVNNPIALKNTELVRTYVAIDPRVRPLAMIIKHWAKRRILNDAALGGTLSSYTWICLALNFLQTRDPPILPALQQSKPLQPKILDGINVAFEQNIDPYKSAATHNKSSLGDLLFRFFRYYGHEFDFETHALSLRLGKVLPKTEKAWHLLQDNRLCVEEPFNTFRNLANTADDTSMRGIHLELRRAFALISESKLDECCEQFNYPPEETKSSEYFIPPSTRPVVSQVPTQPPRGGRNVSRGTRQTSHLHRNTPGRRSSNPAGRTQVYLRNLPFQMTTHELQLQAQHQQRLLHDQLFQQYQYLQQQEQELRMQLHQQNLRQRGMLASASYQSAPFGTYTTDEGDRHSNTAYETAHQTPLSAPLYQQRFASNSPYLSPVIPNQGVITNPSSPYLMPTNPDTRRYPRRTSVNQSSAGGSHRAQSQPARPVAMPGVLGQLSQHVEYATGADHSMARRSSASSASQENPTSYMHQNFGIAAPFYDANRRPAEYVGYYVGQSPSLLGYSSSGGISPIPLHAGLAIQNGGLSPHLSSSTLASLGAGSSSAQNPQTVTPSVEGETYVGMSQNGAINSEYQNGTVNPNRRQSGPLVVDGSLRSPPRRRPNGINYPHMNDNLPPSTSASEDLVYDTTSSSDEFPQGLLDTAQSDNGLSYGAIERMQQIQREKQTPNLNGSMGQDNVRAHHLAESPLNDHILNESKERTSQAYPSQASTASWKFGRQLSSVAEVKTPSPTKSQQKIGLSSIESKGQHLIGKQESPEHQEMKSRMKDLAIHDPAPLTTRPNGLAQPITTEVHASVPVSGWQTQKKKKKHQRSIKSENDLDLPNFAGGDNLPHDEALRKGG